MNHWKAELNSSVFRRVLNELSELDSRVGTPKQMPCLAAADLRRGIRRRYCPSDFRLRDGL